MTDIEFKITQLCSLARAFLHFYLKTSRETLVLPSNMFLLMDFDYIRYYPAMDSGVQLFQPLFCSDKEFLSSFNMSVWSALTQERAGLQGPNISDLAAMSGHGENLLSLSHINGRRFTKKKREGNTTFFLSIKLCYSSLNSIPVPPFPHFSFLLVH